jgi:tetratricopeptide (TPR) repeat protein
VEAKAAREVLRKVERHYADWRARVRSSFVLGEVVPALSVLEREKPAEPELLATGYCFLGDLWDFLDAPRAAAAAYRAALRHDAQDKWAWAELGSMLCKTGRYRAALRALRRAQALPGEYALLDTEVDWAVEGLRDREPAWYENGTLPRRPAPSWDVCELLARNRPRAALALLRGKRHPYLRQLRARTYGALGDATRMIDEWEGIASTSGDIELEHGDWFFFPDRVWHDPRFWHALYAVRRRFVHGWSSMHEYMWTIVAEPKRYRRDSKAYVERHRRRMALWLRFHVARTERDAAAAGRLARRYPGWRRAQTLARHLSGGG